MHIDRKFALTLLAALLIIGQSVHAEVRALPGGDIAPPDIAHTPLDEFPAGMPLRIQARVTDESRVQEVVLFFRNAGEMEYRRIPMVSAPGSDLYSATLPANAGPRVEYFIQASDTAGNAVLGRLFDPYVIAIRPSATSGPERDVARTSPPAAPPPVARTPQEPVAAAPSRIPPKTSVETAASSSRERRGISRWIWVGVGVVAVAAIAGGGGGGGGGSPAPADPDAGGTGTVTITAPVP